MTTLERRPCPRCGKDVAWRVIQGPRVNRGPHGAIPPLKLPVRHKRTTGWSRDLTETEWCPAGEGRR
jgi:hypothetical protein